MQKVVSSNNKHLLTYGNSHQRYNTKIKIYSDDYIEITRYPNSIYKAQSGIQECNIENLTEEVETLVNEHKNGVIRKDSLSRTRNLIFNISLSNKEDWTSFITLTFDTKKELQDVSQVQIAVKYLQNWVRQVKRIQSNFKYLAVPEYQKRGIIHFHLITNIKCDSDLIPKRKDKKTYNVEKKKWTILQYYDLKYWTYGYSSAFDLINDTDINFRIEKYITKYLYKDLDNRLFAQRKVYYSSNCRMAIEETYFISEEALKEYIENSGSIYDVKEKDVFTGNKYVPSLTFITLTRKSIA